MDKRTKYIAIFREEAAEHLANLSLGLMELELRPEDKELIHSLLRAAHTLKGSAKMLGLEQIGEVAHKMEDLFKAIEDKLIGVSSETVDALLAGTDTIKEIVDSVGAEVEKEVDIQKPLHKLMAALEILEKPEKEQKEEKHPKKEKHKEKPKQEKPPEVKTQPEPQGVPEPAPEPEPAPLSTDEKMKTMEADVLRRYGKTEKDTIRVDTQKLDTLLNVAGELLINKIKMESHLHHLGGMIEKLERTEAKPGKNGGNPLETVKQLSENLQNMKENLQDLFQNLGDSVVELDFFSQEIRNQAMGLRVLPARVLFDEFYRTVRDFAKELKKEIRLEVTGGETELDKQLIEELRPALVHIIRNSCDHGIETPEVRTRLGKPTEGFISIHAYHKGHNVIVEIYDDGSGLNPQKLRRVAVEKGLVTRQAADEMGDQEALYLVLRPGFSTSPIITDFSGRGVGMDVVKTNIERIKGDITIESEIDKFTKVILTAPLTLSIMNALLIKVRDDIYAIPLTYVQETVRLQVGAIFTEAGRDAFNLRGEVIPLVKLETMLGYPVAKGIETIPQKIPVVVLKFRNQRLGLIVDHYLRDQEIVVKSMGPFLGEVPFVGGATVLRYGEPAIILNAFDIFASAEKWAEMGILEQIERAREEIPELRILVVDDSITTRMMEKSILEAAGYKVDLAISGEEAEDLLGKNIYDLIVTDLQMPGIDGFELTRRIRTGERTKEMPVVMVTSLSSDEDKRKGVEVGAQAYIVKGSFDQTTLLDAIKSLIG